jgi:hypothetical protein
MLRLILGIVISMSGAAVVIVTAQSARFRSMIAREVQALSTGMSATVATGIRGIDTLPVPVRNYLGKALRPSAIAVQAVRFRHSGRFRARLDGPWRPIRGQQYDVTNPPGFLWWGRLRVAPGLWIDARDRCLNGVGNMLISLESTVALADRSGPELDQGSMLRLLSDLVLLPAVLLDDRYVTWAAIDERQARATLRLAASAVSGTFEFGPDSLPRRFFADRYLDTGNGRSEVRPWSGEYEDYREVDGMIVPHHFIGYWHINGQRIAYVDFLLERPEYNRLAAF